jgi:hypothetical protein
MATVLPLRPIPLPTREAAILSDIAQAFAAGELGVDPALEARVVALENTVSIILASLAAAGIPLVTPPGTLDFSNANNSGLLALFTIGGF